MSKNLIAIEVEFGTPAHDETVKLRDDILRKPLGLAFTPEQLSKEYADIHLACYNSQHDLVGCLVLARLDNKELKMRQVAVREDCQRMGIGQFMVEESENIAQRDGFEKMVLHARNTAVPFYLKLDYKKIGKPFTEVKLKHYKMEKTMSNQEVIKN